MGQGTSRPVGVSVASGAPCAAPGGDFWVFGYGSLMWNPGFPHVRAEHATLHGFHRSFCIYSHVYRGTPKCPGLVLGLDRGGSCRGMAFQVHAGDGQEVQAYLFEREMLHAVYRPRWVPVRIGGRAVPAYTFVVDRGNAQYAGRLDTEALVRLVLQGRGSRGPCREYLERTVRHLESMGIVDGPLHELLERVEARCGAQP
jgi:cation transport protein ChaC